jgi:hypothetical protein
VKALDLISSSMRLIGALASGETPTNAEAQDALTVLNQMLDSWAADRLMVFTIAIDEYPMVPGQQIYTYGVGGDFDALRPARIDRVSIISLTNPAMPLELPIDYLTGLDWQQYPVKNIQTTLPQAVYDDQAFPFRNLSFWPIPTIAVNTRIYNWVALDSYAGLTADNTYPPGYIEALRYNLALRLMAEFPGGFDPVMSQTTAALAVESLARVKSMNLPLIEAFCDAALTSKSVRYNYFSDTPVGGQGSRW